MPYWGQLGFQDPAAWIMIALVTFHDHAMMMITMILSFVAYALLALITNKQSCTTIVEAHKAETAWTIIPAVILLSLAFPSLRLLYLMDEVMDPHLTIKAIGNQWYWSYEYAEFDNLSFASYMLPTNELSPQRPFRLLEVDNRLLLPANIDVRILVTSTDVMHSWTIPSFGVKADAIPGRLNQLGIFALFPGVYYGQCSEICGANHSFMPIAVEVRSTHDFCELLLSAQNNQ